MMSSSTARPRTTGNRLSAWGGLSSMLRLAAHERRATAQRSGWWAGMSRMLRAGGPNPHARPLHAVLAAGDFAASGWTHSR